MLWLDGQDCAGRLLMQNNATVLELMQEQMQACRAAAASYL
jgi:hypothetical protein